MALSGKLLRGLGFCGFWLAWPAAAAISVSQVPLAGVGGRYGPNVLLGLSVEFPTAGEAYTNRTFDSTELSKDHKGYFDQYKCYAYQAGSGSTPGYFYPVSLVNNATNRTCSGSNWSGSLLNWATMSAIDVFRQTLTGGNRALGTSGTATDYTAGDTASLTVLRGARIVSGQNQGYGFNTVRKLTTNVSSLSPYSYSQLRFTSLNWSTTVEGSNNGTTWTTLGTFNVMAKVCTTVSGVSNSQYSSLGLTSKYGNGIEDNCTGYGSNYKPEGLIQQYGGDMRFSVFSYLIDANYNRDGGVLRARMKYPGISSSSTSATTSSNIFTLGAEWSNVNGVFAVNPDVTDATGSSVANSGVINYLNKFGDNNGYKTYDPAAELYYAALRYFRKIGNYSAYSGSLTAAMKDNFPVITDWDDPIVNSCQQNFIIYIGDTNTHGDVDLPGSAWPVPSGNQTSPLRPPNDDAASNMGSPPVSGNGSGVTAWTNSIGNQEGVSNLSSINTGSTNSPPFIAGLAYWGNVTDLRPDLTGKQTVNAFMIDVVENGNAKTQTTNPFYLAAKYGGFTDTDGTQTPGTRSEWTSDPSGATSIAAYPNGVPKNFAQASDPSRMTTALQSAFASISAATDPTLAGLSTTSSGSQVFSSAYVFQSSFDSTDWHGDLIAYQIVQANAFSAPTLVQDSSHGWRAKNTLETQLNSNLAGRTVLTYDVAARLGATFNSAWFSGLAATNAQKLALNSTDAQGAARVSYLRGDKTNEATGSSPQFRPRNYRLGDIVNSSPVYMAAPAQDPADCAFAANSSTQATDRAAIFSRPAMVMVAANDGFLHGFDMSGNERFAYLPGGIFANLPSLTSPSYVHQYYNDGTPNARDVCFTLSSSGSALTVAEARTVVVGTTGAGGNSVYALDITLPGSMGASSVLWEFTSADDPNLGQTIGNPQIVKLQNGRPAVIFGNGYNQTGSGGLASIFVLYLDKAQGEAWARGSNYFRIDVPNQSGQSVSPNAMGSPTAVDTTGDGMVDFVYAGDINGNLWKFNLNSATPSSWGISAWGTAGNYNSVCSSACLPLISAYSVTTSGSTQALGVRQPITAAPVVTRDSQKGYLVLFGTGQFLSDSDRTVGTQALYGVRDTGLALTNPITGSLLQQTIGSQLSGTVGGTFNATSSTAMSSSSNGWYIQLTANERVVAKPLLRGTKTVRFNSIIPDSTGCTNGGTSWVTEVNIFSGGMSSTPVFDTNGDGVINSSDQAAGRFRPGDSSGVTGGTPLRLIDQNGYEWICTAGSGGKGGCVRVNTFSGSFGRLSWREIIQTW